MQHLMPSKRVPVPLGRALRPRRRSSSLRRMLPASSQRKHPTGREACAQTKPSPAVLFHFGVSLFIPNTFTALSSAIPDSPHTSLDSSSVPSETLLPTAEEGCGEQSSRRLFPQRFQCCQPSGCQSSRVQPAASLLSYHVPRNADLQERGGAASKVSKPSKPNGRAASGA